MKKPQQPTQSNNQVSNQDILLAMNQFADQMEQRFQGIDQRFDTVEHRLNHVENTMVTKDYLDDKLANLKAEFFPRTKQTDSKLNRTIDLLHQKNIFNHKEALSLKQV